MPYQITHFSGTPLATVDDGTIDQTTDLKLVGKNYAGYGTIQNDNYVYLLENFANITSPPKAIAGQLWYDSGNNKLKFYDKNSNWRTTGGTTTSAAASPPTGLTLGDLWYTTDTKQLYVFNSDQTTTLIGPQGVTGAGQAGLETVTVLGTDTLPHTIILCYVNTIVTFIMSSDSFTLDSTINPIIGYTHINQGITLINSATGLTTTAYRLWGTASTADAINISGTAVPGTSLIQASNPTFTGQGHFPDTGLTVGTTSNDLQVFIDTGNNRLPTIQNVASSQISFKVKDSISSTVRNPLVLNSLNANPGADLVYDLGSSIARWNNVWVGTIHSSDIYGTLHGSLSGTADRSNSLLYNGVYVSAVATATANTIMARDASANTAVNILTASTINASTVGSVSTTYYGTLSGTATNANNILYNYDGSHATNFVTATDQNVVNSVIARDSSGNFAANIMTGTATKAKYADLAEKYLADIAYEPGTVLVFGGEEEVTTTTEYADTRVAGVVSTDPAYLMNSESSGVAVALRGKVPVKVSGMIKKGDLLVTSTISGYAEAAQHSGVTASAVFAKSLENKSDSGLGVIMAVVV
jgi:hypothetical protein